VQDINTVYANGRAENAAFTLTAVEVKEIQGNTAAAEVHYVVPAYKVVDHQGHVTEEIPYSQGDDYLSLVRKDAAWMLGNTFDLNSGTGA
jgi:hypothetical protein